MTTIRPMRWWDLDQVLAIEAEAFGATAWPAESFWGELARPDRYYVVAGDETVLGYAGLWSVPPDADIQTLAVSPSARGKGLGHDLLAHLLTQARAGACRRMHLEVKADNAAAISLYESAGFGLVRRRPRYYPDLSDAFVMGLDL